MHVKTSRNCGEPLAKNQEPGSSFWTAWDEILGKKTREIVDFPRASIARIHNDFLFLDPIESYDHQELEGMRENIMLPQL